jgi:hypothetical protein
MKGISKSEKGQFPSPLPFTLSRNVPESLTLLFSTLSIYFLLSSPCHHFTVSCPPSFAHPRFSLSLKVFSLC